MFVIIVGGGRTGSELAKELINQKHKVYLIESRKDVLNRVHRELPTEVIIEGNIIDTDILESADIKNADVVAAVTSSDEQNLVVCYLARKKYKVPRIIARVNNPGNAWLFNDNFNIDVAVNHTDILTRIIQEEMSLGDMMTLLKLRRGNYSLVEEKISAGAHAIGMEIKDLQIEGNCVIAAIIRHGEIVVPHGNTVFEVNDEVLAVTDEQGMNWLQKILTGPKSVR